MSNELPAVARAHCRVCGHAVTDRVCTCAACQTPAHLECFAYAGGCSIFGCGSIGALFPGAPPAGWRESSVPVPGTWLIPPESVPQPGRGRIMDRALNDCFQHWRTTAQLELFSVIGQTWFSGVTLALVIAGRWKLNPGLVATIAIVVIAHLTTLSGLLRLGLILTSPDGETPLERPRRAVAARAGAMRWSRRLHLAGVVALAIGLVLGTATAPAWVLYVAVFCAVVPWFSLAPRWRLERPLLEAATGPGARGTEPPPAPAA